MKKLTIREARQALTHLDLLLPVEGELTITRRGDAIARALPVKDRKRAISSHRNLRSSMARMRKGREKLVREDRDAG